MAQPPFAWPASDAPPTMSPPRSAANATPPVTPAAAAEADGAGSTAQPGDLPSARPPQDPGIIRAKVQPPAVRAATLSRRRLLDRLEAAGSRLTLLVAEAGYGKTTLLGDFARQSPTRCIWYRLDSTDRDWVTIVNYLIHSVRELVPEFAAGPGGLLAQVAATDVPRDLVLRRLVAELDQLGPEPAILVLDDFHAVEGSADAIDIVTRLLADAPAALRFFISSRRRPPLPFGRLAALGELSELTTADLRFSRAEIERLFTEIYGQPLEIDVLADVDSRTEGWAASLQLFYSSIRGRPSAGVRAFARSLSAEPGPIYDYLAQEVLGGLRPGLRDFLLRASILTQVIPAHVEALYSDGEDGQRPASIRDWMAEAERLGLLHRSSQSSE
ncbi:MAG TPA: AAA family ATPase, partial [Candidatus Limnocylindria bacterium]|nr:AAA family ATPase [Candidatus Limnocylindria bacterium]